MTKRPSLSERRKSLLKLSPNGARTEGAPSPCDKSFEDKKMIDFYIIYLLYISL
jgi:hypothetical protein